MRSLQWMQKTLMTPDSNIENIIQLVPWNQLKEEPQLVLQIR